MPYMWLTVDSSGITQVEVITMMLHDEARELMVEAYEKNHDAKGIAKIFHISTSTVIHLAENFAPNLPRARAILSTVSDNSCHRHGATCHMSHHAFCATSSRSFSYTLTLREPPLCRSQRLLQPRQAFKVSAYQLSLPSPWASLQMCSTHSSESIGSLPPHHSCTNAS